MSETPYAIAVPQQLRNLTAQLKRHPDGLIAMLRTGGNDAAASKDAVDGPIADYRGQLLPTAKSMRTVS